MGYSPEGILAYGYELGGLWNNEHVREVDERGDLLVDWYDDGDDAPTFKEQLEAKLKDVPGVEMVDFGDGQADEMFLAAYSMSRDWDAIQQLNLKDLADRPEQEHWDTSLAAALKTLGLTPKGTPGWYLGTYYNAGW